MIDSNSYIQTQLSSIEDELLQSLELGPGALENFDERWAALHRHISNISPGILDDRTRRMMNAVAENVAVITGAFLDLSVASDQTTQNLHKEWATILDEAETTLIEGAVTHPPILHASLMETYHPKYYSSLSSTPPFIAPAYRWLMKNLHDPYPSNDVKDSFARSTGSSSHSISAWFTNVRRRMGWTALSRQYFGGCRANTVDAAYRALVQEDPKRTLESNVIHAFMVVKVTAEGLYSSKFKKSALAGQLDVVVKDMTDEDKVKIEKRKVWEAEEVKKRKGIAKEQRRKDRAERRESLKATRFASKSYPSPVGSPHESPVPVLEDSLTDESDEDDIALPQIFAGNKRCASSSSASTMSTPSRCDERPLIRHRSNSKEPETVATPSISALPSPPSEVGINHGVFDYWSSEVVELPVALNVPSLPASVQSRSRKRRLSDGAAQGAPKRPCGLVGPRLHAVSDPLPKTNELADDFNAWLMGNFEIPPAVADEVPDPSTLLDVDIECYNWSSMQDCYKTPVEGSTMLASPPYSTRPYDSFNMDSNTFSITDINHLSTGDNLDELYQNIFGTNSHHPPPYSSQPVDGVPPSLTCVTSDSGITSTIPPMSFSDDLFSDGGAWSHLPSYTDATDPFNPSSVHSSIPESAHPLNLSSILSEIDLSMLQLPTSSPSHIPHQNEEATRFADKQAKLEQLRILEEAKRRLEAELASDT